MKNMTQNGVAQIPRSPHNAGMERPRTSSWLAIVIVLVLLTPLFYVLSVGPAVWLCERGVIGEGPASVVYAPLEWLTDVSPPFQSIMESYIDLWDGQDYVQYQNAPLPLAPVPPTPSPSADGLIRVGIDFEQ